MSSTTVSSDGTIEISPQTHAHTAVVVFLHGLGDSGHGWAQPIGMLAKEMPHIKFILPSAAPRPVTVNGGRPMPAWYDVKSMDKKKDDRTDGIEDSRARVIELIEKEVAAGIPYSRIVLGGFSQGGAMSLTTGYQLKKMLAGVLCLSGFIPQKFYVTPETKEVPAFMCHGDADPVVTIQRALTAKVMLESSGVSNVDFRIYSGMRHSTSVAEIQESSNGSALCYQRNWTLILNSNPQS